MMLIKGKQMVLQIYKQVPNEEIDAAGIYILHNLFIW